MAAGEIDVLFVISPVAWWFSDQHAWQDSNLQPPASKAGALSS